MAKTNLLIGNGTVLTNLLPKEAVAGGGDKSPTPYTIEEAREFLSPALRDIAEQIDKLPESAKPSGEATAVITIHPAYLSKWKMPNKVLANAGLKVSGSKSALIHPRKEKRKSIPAGEQFTAELYVAGNHTAFNRLLEILLSEKSHKYEKHDLCKIEAIRFLAPHERLIKTEGQDTRVPIEILVHSKNMAREELLDALDQHAEACGTTVARSKLYEASGLIFMPGVAPREKLEDFAAFTALRAVRRLPELRMHRPPLKELLTTTQPTLPKEAAVNQDLKVAVFDGGLEITDFSKWAKEVVPDALQKTEAGFLTHGAEVTSVLLFGALDHETTQLPRPLFNVTHYRVIGSADDGDFDLYDCMHRIDEILSNNEIDCANLAFGPRMAMNDNHPHAWTAMLDKHLASGKTLMTVATGNDGELGEELGRIQVPGDAINALTIGAASSQDMLFIARAPFSGHGPGRSPGVVKPDGLCFGGTPTNPMLLYSPLAGGVTERYGTSYAAPLAQRATAGAKALSKTDLSATSLRALMVHNAVHAQQDQRNDVGWGQFPEDPEALLAYGDNQVSVLYQGDIPAGRTMRMQLPIPLVGMGTGIVIKATFCFACPVETANPVNYTQHGLTPIFRTHSDGPSHPFFGKTSDYEQNLRKNGSKWETMLHATQRFEASQLLDPCFDVTHGAREDGLPVINDDTQALPYVLIITVASELGQHIYQSIMSRYPVLTPIELRSQVRLRG